MDDPKDEITRFDDYFWLERYYPASAASLDWKPKSLGAIKNDCIVCIDTNVLFVLFSSSKNKLAAQLKIFEQLAQAGRLFVPIHAVREFLHARHFHLKTLNQRLKTFEERLYKYEKEFNEDLAENKSSIFSVPVVGSIEAAIKSIQAVKNAVALDDDAIVKSVDEASALIGSSLQPAVFDPAFDAAQQSAIIFDHELRLKHSVGPGFKDRDKSDKGIVLLRHKIKRFVRLICRVQHGQRESFRTMATINLRRIVAIEFGI